jgi:hypothetical protein
MYKNGIIARPAIAHLHVAKVKGPAYLRPIFINTQEYPQVKITNVRRAVFNNGFPIRKVL